MLLSNVRWLSVLVILATLAIVPVAVVLQTPIANCRHPPLIADSVQDRTQCLTPSRPPRVIRWDAPVTSTRVNPLAACQALHTSRSESCSNSTIVTVLWRAERCVLLWYPSASPWIDQLLRSSHGAHGPSTPVDIFIFPPLFFDPIKLLIMSFTSPSSSLIMSPTVYPLPDKRMLTILSMYPAQDRHMRISM